MIYSSIIRSYPFLVSLIFQSPEKKTKAKPGPPKLAAKLSDHEISVGKWKKTRKFNARQHATIYDWVQGIWVYVSPYLLLRGVLRLLWMSYMITFDVCHFTKSLYFRIVGSNGISVKVTNEFKRKVRSASF